MFVSVGRKGRVFAHFDSWSLLSLALGLAFIYIYHCVVIYTNRIPFSSIMGCHSQVVWLRGEVLHLHRGAVSIFYSPKWQGGNIFCTTVLGEKQDDESEAVSINIIVTYGWIFHNSNNSVTTNMRCDQKVSRLTIYGFQIEN